VPNGKTALPPNAPFLAHRSDGTKVALLIVFNALWNGAGNLFIGDKKGWIYVWLNVVFLFIGAFTAFLPVVGLFIYCSYQGWQYLQHPTELK
jgi:heme/copper-type cytochrome/quinol oxidase subunit 2